MTRDFTSRPASVRGDYREPVVAQSMAFDTADLAEHRKRFPGVEVQIDGRSAIPVLTSHSQRKAYMKQRGWRDNNGFD